MNYQLQTYNFADEQWVPLHETTFRYWDQRQEFNKLVPHVKDARIPLVFRILDTDHNKPYDTWHNQHGYVESKWNHDKPVKNNEDTTDTTFDSI